MDDNNNPNADDQTVVPGAGVPVTPVAGTGESAVSDDAQETPGVGAPTGVPVAEGQEQTVPVPPVAGEAPAADEDDAEKPM